MLKKIIIGLSAGIISGLFSTGGGMILVPAFLYFIKMDSIKARATCVCCILFTTIVSSFFYYKHDYIQWNVSILCAIGGIIGGYIGAKFLYKIPDYIIRIIFVVFLLYASYKNIF